VCNRVIGKLLTVTLLGLAGCGEAFVNLTAPLGGARAGDRGTFRVLFINNTPHRAVCTFGSYDRTDQFFEPDFAQLALDESGVTLSGGSTSEIATLQCARAFGIGSPRLLELIETNLPDADLDPGAFVAGVDFYDATSTEGEPGSGVPRDLRITNVGQVENLPKGSNDAVRIGNLTYKSQDSLRKVGAAPPFEALLGIDFPCDALLIIRFEFDDLTADTFRVDFEFVPSGSTR
jgi:hypothetical protein